jgi:hypothetical protein
MNMGPTEVDIKTRRIQQRRLGSYEIGPTVDPGHDLVGSDWDSVTTTSSNVLLIPIMSERLKCRAISEVGRGS